MLKKLLQKLIANGNLEYIIWGFIINSMKLLEPPGLKLPDLIYIYNDFIVMFLYSVRTSLLPSIHFLVPRKYIITGI